MLFQSSLFALVAALASMAAAAPVGDIKREDWETTVGITFIGAADAQYFLEVPLNGYSTATNNVLSISHLQMGPGQATCTFSGVDGLELTLTGDANGAYSDVGPPQTLTTVICNWY